MRPFAIGIDVGGTKIAAGVLDREMNLLAIEVTKDHAGRLPVHVVDAMERAYRSVLDESGVEPSDVAGVGLSFAGHTDGRRGVVLTSSERCSTFSAGSACEKEMPWGSMHTTEPKRAATRPSST